MEKVTFCKKKIVGGVGKGSTEKGTSDVGLKDEMKLTGREEDRYPSLADVDQPSLPHCPLPQSCSLLFSNTRLYDGAAMIITPSLTTSGGRQA